MAERGRLARLPGVWAEHRERPGSLAAADPEELHSAGEVILAGTLERQPRLYRPLARAARANLELRSGMSHYRAGNFGRARHHLWRSILSGRLRPTVQYLMRSLVASTVGGVGGRRR